MIEILGGDQNIHHHGVHVRVDLKRYHKSRLQLESPVNSKNLKPSHRLGLLYSTSSWFYGTLLLLSPRLSRLNASPPVCQHSFEFPTYRPTGDQRNVWPALLDFSLSDTTKSIAVQYSICPGFKAFRPSGSRI
ncbi:unnamed protein product [Somion occarium]|uniref:Uncharacterized protein n=1 Tax=Somion occarium TaxID=3059160 RepID=A0ABP1DZ71_9APHY